MYTFVMKKYQKNLQIFIESIRKREIIKNEVVIGELSPCVIEKLKEYNVAVDNQQSFLFKIVIQPNYKTKKGLINNILTSGIIKRIDLNSEYYEEVDLESMVGT